MLSMTFQNFEGPYEMPPKCAHKFTIGRNLEINNGSPQISLMVIAMIIKADQSKDTASDI